MEFFIGGKTRSWVEDQPRPDEVAHGDLGDDDQQLHERGFKGTKNCSLLEAPKMHSPKYSFQTPLHILGLHVLYSRPKT